MPSLEASTALVAMLGGPGIGSGHLKLSTKCSWETVASSGAAVAIGTFPNDGNGLSCPIQEPHVATGHLRYG